MSTMTAAAQTLLDRPLPLLARSVLYPFGAMVVATLAWASMAEVDRVVVAQGRIVTAERPMVVQSFEVGVIRSIDVAPGQAVHRGQVLATLDPTLAEAAERELASKRAILAAQAGRLAAELAGGIYAAVDAGTVEALEGQLSAQRVAEYRTRLAGFEVIEHRLRSREASLTLLLRASEGRLAIARDLEGMRYELQARNAGTRVALLQAQSERLELEEKIEASRGDIEDLRRQLEANAADRALFDHGWRRETAEKLTEIRRDLEAGTQQLAAAQRRRELVTLRAPYDGTVLEVGRRSVGSVVQEAETLVTLVPAASPMEAEVEIGPSDVGHAHPGDRAHVKLSALFYQRHGMLEGSVRLIDADALPSAQDGRPAHHRARIALPDPTLPSAPAGFRLMPGMEVSAEVRVGSRTILSYFLEPILRVRREGLRER